MKIKKLLQSLWNEYNCFKRKLIRTRHPNVYIYNEIPFDILPKSTILGHGGLGIVINRGVKIGKHVFIGQNVTLGGKEGKRPVIENYVEIYTNACVIGGVTVGHHSKIAPGAVVFSDIPPYSLVVGYSKIYKDKYKGDTETKKEQIDDMLDLPTEKNLDLMPRKDLKRLIYDLAAEKYLKKDMKPRIYTI